MARKKRYKVFVSYSRHDEGLVRPLAGLLGATAGTVFLDVDSIGAGDAWRKRIETAVRECSVFIICWCCASERSQFVQHEIAVALEDMRKRLVPVLLCTTPLPASLGDCQWIDMRDRIVHECDLEHHARSGDLPKDAPLEFHRLPEPRSRRLQHWRSMALALILLMAAAGFIVERSIGHKKAPVAEVQPPRAETAQWRAAGDEEYRDQQIELEQVRRLRKELVSREAELDRRMTRWLKTRPKVGDTKGIQHEMPTMPAWTIAEAARIRELEQKILFEQTMIQERMEMRRAAERSPTPEQFYRQRQILFSQLEQRRRASEDAEQKLAAKVLVWIVGAIVSVSLFGWWFVRRRRAARSRDLDTIANNAVRYFEGVAG